MMSQQERWQERLNKVLTLYSAPMQKKVEGSQDNKKRMKEGPR